MFNFGCGVLGTRYKVLTTISRSFVDFDVSVLKATFENKTTSVTTHFKSASYGSKVDTLSI